MIHAMRANLCYANCYGSPALIYRKQDFRSAGMVATGVQDT